MKTKTEVQNKLLPFFQMGDLEGANGRLFELVKAGKITTKVFNQVINWMIDGYRNK